MPGLFPEGLTQKEFDLLNSCVKDASSLTPTGLLERAARHLEKIREAQRRNAYVNLKLAEAIYNNFQIVVNDWDLLPQASYPWLQGMMYYFALSSDLEDDFISPIGFDDDVEIMNACLRFADREDLCLNPEDFDDV